MESLTHYEIAQLLWALAALFMFIAWAAIVAMFIAIIYVRVIKREKLPPHFGIIAIGASISAFVCNTGVMLVAPQVVHEKEHRFAVSGGEQKTFVVGINNIDAPNDTLITATSLDGKQTPLVMKVSYLIMVIEFNPLEKEDKEPFIDHVIKSELCRAVQNAISECTEEDIIVKGDEEKFSKFFSERFNTRVKERLEQSGMLENAQMALRMEISIGGICSTNKRQFMI